MRLMIWLAVLMIVASPVLGKSDIPAESKAKLDAVFAKTVDRLSEANEEAWHTGRHDVCIKLLRVSVELDPNFVQGYDIGAWLLSSAGNDPEAEALYSKGIALNPGIYDLYYDLGMHYNANKDFVHAEENFAEAVKYTCPAFVWKMLAHTQEKNGKLPESLATWEKVRKLTPEDPVVDLNVNRIKAKMPCGMSPRPRERELTVRSAQGVAKGRAVPPSIHGLKAALGDAEVRLFAFRTRTSPSIPSDA